MKRKSLAALAMLPIGLFASSPSTSSETAAAENVVSYSNQQSGNMRNSHNNQYDDQVQVRGQQPMQQEDQRYGLYIMGDYLYWVPYFSNMPYAQKNDLEFQTAPNSSGVFEPGNIITQNMDVSGDSGFRLIASYQSDWQTVGFSVAWTRFHTTDTNSTSNDAIAGNYNTNAGYNGAIQGYWNSNQAASGPFTSTTLGDVVFQANGTFEIKFDQLDFIFNTRYNPTDWCHIQPGIGLRSLLTTMQLRATQVSNKWGSNKVANAPFNTARQVMTQDFDTIGLVTMMNGQFDIYEGFKVVSSLALAYTVGDLKETTVYSVNQESISTDAVGGDAARYQKLRSNRNSFKPQVDADLGLQYEWINDEKTFGFFLEVAYELHYLPNFIQFIRSDGVATVGIWANAVSGSQFQRLDRAIAEWSDLTFQGLRARAGISF